MVEGVMDITQRLRQLYLHNGLNYVQEAADEIERLRAQVAALRAPRAITVNSVLHKASCEYFDDDVVCTCGALNAAIDAARAAGE